MSKFQTRFLFNNSLASAFGYKNAYAFHLLFFILAKDGSNIANIKAKLGELINKYLNYHIQSKENMRNSKHKESQPCRVCSVDVRRRNNYLPSTCEACQKFFRRTLIRQNQDQLVCSGGNLNCTVVSGKNKCQRCLDFSNVSKSG